MDHFKSYFSKKSSQSCSFSGGISHLNMADSDEDFDPSSNENIFHAVKVMQRLTKMPPQKLPKNMVETKTKVQFTNHI